MGSCGYAAAGEYQDDATVRESFQRILLGIDIDLHRFLAVAEVDGQEVWVQILVSTEEIVDEGTPEIETPDTEVSLPFELNAFSIGLITAAAGLIAAAYAEAGARQSVTKIIEELQALVDAGVTDSELNKSIEELENMEGIRYLSSDRADALELLNNYNEVQGQALGAMQQLDELESVVAELEAAGVSSPELDAEIAEIQSMLETQLEGDTSEDYSKTLFDQFKQNKGGE